MIKKDSRVMFVVDSLESDKECFETYGEATLFVDRLNADKHEHVTFVAQIVNNTYKDTANGKEFINYNDLSDTFGEILIEFSTN
jgi:hypothetical protein